jgi:hypothetical protein
MSEEMVFVADLDEGSPLDLDQSARAECLRIACELTVIQTPDHIWSLARWLYDGSTP